MPSSISSFERLTAADRPGVAQPVPQRPVPVEHSGALLLAALALAFVLLGAWEIYWRHFGAVPGYRDDDALWAIQRRRIDHGEGDATVFVGASRTNFDLQLPVWERLSGRRPIQLSVDGTSPAFAFEDLADDPAFTGRLLIGVAPDLFFSGFETTPGLSQFTRKESPSQKVGKWLSMRLVEPFFAFYDSDFALFKVLRRQTWWPQRPRKMVYLQVRKLEVTGPDRNSRMWRKVETDADYAALIARIWAQTFAPPPTDPADLKEIDAAQNAQIERALKAVAKLRTRGVPVIFVREPSGGEYLAYEHRVLPRSTTWDVLVSKAGVPSIHFEDYAELQNLQIPDGSHLAGESADRYTEALYGIIDRQYGTPAGVHW
jgi:hypothetical protein